MLLINATTKSICYALAFIVVSIVFVVLVWYWFLENKTEEMTSEEELHNPHSNIKY